MRLFTRLAAACVAAIALSGCSRMTQPASDAAPASEPAAARS